MLRKKRTVRDGVITEVYDDNGREVISIRSPNTNEQLNIDQKGYKPDKERVEPMDIRDKRRAAEANRSFYEDRIDRVNVMYPNPYNNEYNKQLRDERLHSNTQLDEYKQIKKRKHSGELDILLPTDFK
jgi:hypothetical protein